jgi:putative FmdB family regulatory protein
MPTYVYECIACRHSCEVEQRITEEPLKQCPACGAKKGLRRVIQPVGLLFKGPGFHVTDYAKKPFRGEKKAEPDGKAECSGDPSSCPTCGD